MNPALDGRVVYDSSEQCLKHRAGYRGTLDTAYVRAALARSMPRDERRLIEDVEDQFNRVRRLYRGQKELLQGALDFSRTRTSAKMDLAMSRIALLSAVALPISIISSIYGMQLWVFTTARLDILAMMLALMGVLTFGMLRWVRSQGWW